MSARKSGRTQLVLVALVFLGPLGLAAWLYFGGGGLQPQGRTNHGELLEPFVNLANELGAESPLNSTFADTWSLIYSNRGDCAVACRDALYTVRQSRLMLGKEMDRLQRVFLHGESPPDTVFLDQQHPGLIRITDSRLGELLDDKRPTGLTAGGFFLVDPLGNLVMYFRPDIDPADMVDDIKHLLRLSRIG